MLPVNMAHSEMMSAPSSDEMYTRLMAIHRDACTTRRYEVSYYLLAGKASCVAPCRRLCSKAEWWPVEPRVRA
jgi:hypothetical protein